MSTPYDSLSDQDKERLRQRLDANSKDDLIDLLLGCLTPDDIGAILEAAIQSEEDNKTEEG